LGVDGTQRCGYRKNAGDTATPATTVLRLTQPPLRAWAGRDIALRCLDTAARRPYL